MFTEPFFRHFKISFYSCIANIFLIAGDNYLIYYLLQKSAII